MRQKYCIGNWKMNLTVNEAISLAGAIAAHIDSNNKVKTIVCPTFLQLLAVKKILENTTIKIAAQNCAATENGAYTGEVSAAMLATENISYVLIGHSERRQYFGESDKLIFQKLKLAMQYGLTPIFCCGESLTTRENNEQKTFVLQQLENSLFQFSHDEFKNIIIAYEPIWAIGTGKTATAEEAQEMHAFLRAVIAEKYGTTIAENCSILYGGSVNEQNARQIVSQQDIDGVLVGGASLKAESFLKIYNSF